MRPSIHGQLLICGRVVEAALSAGGARLLFHRPQQTGSEWGIHSQACRVQSLHLDLGLPQENKTIKINGNVDNKVIEYKL